MPNSNRVSIKITNKIAYVNLNREDKNNALDMDMFLSIKRAIKQLQKDKSIRAVILSGEGENFCSGIDVNAMKSTATGLKLLFKWLPWQSNLAQYVTTGWQTVPVPVIAVIKGRCWGGGLQIAFGADFRISTPDASLSILEGKWGIIPDMGGTIAFKKHMALDITKELAMTGESIDGTKAKAIGMVTHVSSNPMEMAIELATKIVKLNPDAVAGCKKIYNKNWHGSDGMALFREAYYQIRILLGKNQRIKAYNQTHDEDNQKPFINRKSW